MGVIPNRLIQDLFNMAKVSYILVILAGFYLFNSCSNQQKIEASGLRSRKRRLPPEFKNPTELTSPAASPICAKTSTPLPTITLKLSTKTPTIRICSVVFMSFLPPKGELPKRRATPKYLCKKAIKTTSPTSSSP